MNAKARLLLTCLTVISVPASAALAGGRPVGYARPVGARSAQAARPSFRSSGAGFQRPNYAWANNRVSNFSRPTGWNRPAAFNVNPTGTQSFRTTSNRFANSDFNRVSRINNRNRISTSTNNFNRFNGTKRLGA